MLKDSNNDIVSAFAIERSLHPVNFTSRHNPEIHKDMKLDIWELRVTLGKKPSFLNKLIGHKSNSLLNIIITPHGNFDPDKKTYKNANQIYPLLYSTRRPKYPSTANTNQKIEKDELDKLDEYLPMCFIDDINRNDITILESNICLDKETDIVIPIGFAMPSGFYFITPTLKPYYTKDDIPHLNGTTEAAFDVLFNDGNIQRARRVIEIDKYLGKFDVNQIPSETFADSIVNL